jgi:hypothetical protein
MAAACVTVARGPSKPGRIEAVAEPSKASTPFTSTWVAARVDPAGWIAAEVGQLEGEHGVDRNRELAGSRIAVDDRSQRGHPRDQAAHEVIAIGRRGDPLRPAAWEEWLLKRPRGLSRESEKNSTEGDGQGRCRERSAAANL